MDMFYALGMNITKKVCVKYGQTDDVEKKYCKFDEVIALMEQAIKEPENQGNYPDFVELCLLYDKNENGTMMLAELETFLTLMGMYKFTAVVQHGPLPWTVLFEKNCENLQYRCLMITLLLRISQKVYKKYHAQKSPKICTGCRVAQLKFTYITLVK